MKKSTASRQTQGRIPRRLQRFVRPLGIFIIMWIFWSLFSWCVLQFCNPTQKRPENHKPNQDSPNQTNVLLHTFIKVINYPLCIGEGQMWSKRYQINAARKHKQKRSDENSQKNPANPSGCRIICRRMIVGNECRARYGCQC